VFHPEVLSTWLPFVLLLQCGTCWLFLSLLPLWNDDIWCWDVLFWSHLGDFCCFNYSFIIFKYSAMNLTWLALVWTPLSCTSLISTMWEYKYPLKPRRFPDG
jgi:hypothetical protein